MNNNVKIELGIISIILLMGSCFSDPKTDEISIFRNHCIKNDSIFSFLTSVIKSDSIYLNKHIENDSHKSEFKSVITKFKYFPLMEKYSINEIERTSYDIKFRLNSLGIDKEYDVWYIYRNRAMDERNTDKLIIEKLDTLKYLVIEYYW